MVEHLIAIQKAGVRFPVSIGSRITLLISDAIIFYSRPCILKVRGTFPKGQMDGSSPPGAKKYQRSPAPESAFFPKKVIFSSEELLLGGGV